MSVTIVYLITGVSFCFTWILSDFFSIFLTSNLQSWCVTQSRKPEAVVHLSVLYRNPLLFWPRVTLRVPPAVPLTHRWSFPAIQS